MARDEREGRRVGFKMSRLILPSLILIILVFALIVILQPQEEPDLEGKPAPFFQWVDVDENHYNLEDLIGRRILMVFICSESHWSGEITENMKELYEYTGWGATEFVSISADCGDSIDDVRKFRNDHEANWTFIKAPSSVGSDYQITATPTVFIIDEQGIIIDVVVGYQTVQELKDLLLE